MNLEPRVAVLEKDSINFGLRLDKHSTSIDELEENQNKAIGSVKTILWTLRFVGFMNIATIASLCLFAYKVLSKL